MRKQLQNKTILLVFIIIAIVVTSCRHTNGKLFTKVSSSRTGIKFINQLPEKPGLNILYYLYYYEGAGVAVGDINNDRLPDIYFTANTPGANKLYLNKGNLVFEDITTSAGVAGTSEWCTGVTMADINADGWLDIYVCAIAYKSGLKGKNELFINNKNGTFTERGAEYGLNISSYACQAAFFDYDGDSDLDCYLLNQSDKPFERITDTSIRKTYDSLTGDRLLQYNKTEKGGYYTDVSRKAGIYQSAVGYGLGVAISDLNHDGWDDIYIGNDFHENDYCYLNNGNGTFSESSHKLFGHFSRFSMGNDAADCNNDGWPDIVTADMLPDDEKILKTYGSDENADIYQYKILNNGYQHQYSKNALHLNNQYQQGFREVSLLAGVAATDWSWSALMADFDHDGWKDIFFTSGVLKRTTDLDYVSFISNAYFKHKLNKTQELDNEALSKMPDGISHNYLFQNLNGLQFSNFSANAGFEPDKGYFTGAATADLDNDGDLDIVVNAINSEARVYQNNTSDKKTSNYLVVQPQAAAPNTQGFGTKAWLFFKNGIQYLQANPTRGFLSCSDSKFHFGFFANNPPDSLLIVWPSGKYQVIKKDLHGLIIVNENQAYGQFNYTSFFPAATALLQPIASPGVKWKHQENTVTDFHSQRLIPQAKSTLGPKIAIADVNNDGLEDFFVCGAKEQPGSLWLQQKNGQFTMQAIADFLTDAPAEDTDAIFFDANGDGFPDLYVASGGNEQVAPSANLIDRLYINNGKGSFSKAVGFAPPIFDNKSCAVAADVDGDGDNDVFIGVHANAKAYGIPQTSYLLINDGKGKFMLADTSFIDLQQIGMVTSATFADLNNDKKPELIVTGEWMPVTIFQNKGNGFVKSILPNSTGLWQCVASVDLDKDGNMDIVAGNWGWNNKFKHQKEGKLQLYVGDFDKNGSIEQLLSYSLNGREYPFYAKDEVEKQLPLLKKHYLKYAEYAGVEMKEVFYGWIDNVIPLKAEVLATSVFWGKGNFAFQMEALPASFQLSPVMAICQLPDFESKTMLALGGNFFDTSPYEGRYDAQTLSLMLCNGKNHINKKEIYQGAHNRQIRDVATLKINNRYIVAAAANNDSIGFYQLLN